MRSYPKTRPTLLHRIRNPDDEASWQDFSEIYTPVLIQFCRKQGLRDEDVKDVVQEVLRTVSSSIRRFEYDEGRGLFRSWLFRVTSNKLKQFYAQESRRHRNLKVVRDESLQRHGEDPAPQAEAEWMKAYQMRLFEVAAERARRSFSDICWQAFWRSSVLHQDVAEVAASLDMNRAALYAAKFRILRRIREEIAQISGEQVESDVLP